MICGSQLARSLARSLALYADRKYGVRRLEFPSKNWSRRDLEDFLRRLRAMHRNAHPR